MNDGKPESISGEMLAMLQQAQRNAETATTIRQFVVNQIFQQYQLGANDTVDSVTGKISYYKGVEVDIAPTSPDAS